MVSTASPAGGCKLERQVVQSWVPGGRRPTQTTAKPREPTRTCRPGTARCRHPLAGRHRLRTLRTGLNGLWPRTAGFSRHPNHPRTRGSLRTSAAVRASRPSIWSVRRRVRIGAATSARTTRANSTNLSRIVSLLLCGGPLPKKSPEEPCRPRAASQGWRGACDESTAMPATGEPVSCLWIRVTICTDQVGMNAKYRTS